MFVILVVFIIETPLSIVEVPPTESACHFADLKDMVASSTSSIKPSDTSVDSQEGKVNDMNASITMYSKYISHHSLYYPKNYQRVHYHSLFRVDHSVCISRATTK